MIERASHPTLIGMTCAPPLWDELSLLLRSPLGLKAALWAM